MLLQDRHAAGRAQLVELRVGALFLSRDPGVADEASGGARVWPAWGHVLLASTPFLQIDKAPVNDRLQRWPIRARRSQRGRAGRWRVRKAAQKGTFRPENGG